MKYSTFTFSTFAAQLAFPFFSCLRFSYPCLFHPDILLSLWPSLNHSFCFPFLIFTQHFSSLPLNFSSRATHNFAINFMRRISTKYREQTAFLPPSILFTLCHHSFFSWVPWKIEVCVVKFRFLTYLTFFNKLCWIDDCILWVSFVVMRKLRKTSVSWAETYGSSGI